MTTAIRVTVAALLGGCSALSLLVAPAGAVTFDLSTLNVNAVTGPRPPHFPVCPCTDPTSGTLIFGSQTNSQSNGWTKERTDQQRRSISWATDEGTMPGKSMSQPAGQVSPFLQGSQ